MTKSNKRRVPAVATAVFAGLVAAACFGAQAGGSDGETHFACSGDRDCLRLGAGFVCVQGVCSSDPQRPDVAAPPSRSSSSSSSNADAGADATTNIVGPDKSQGAPKTPTPRPGDAAGDASSGDASSSATLQGSIVADTSDPVEMSDLAVALVWLPLLVDRDMGPADPTAECMDYYMSIGTIVQPSTSTVVPPSAGQPGSFTLTPIGVPPDEAFPGHIPAAPGSSRMVSDRFAAIGEIIVYRDLNHDGVPNFGSFTTGDGESVVGASSTYLNAFGSLVNSVSYGVTFARHDDDTGAFVYLTGYHAFQDTADWDAFITRSNLVAGQDVLIRLGSDIGVTGLSCVENCFTDASDTACPATIPELPSGGRGTCKPLGTPTPPNGAPSTAASYAWELNTCNSCRCTTRSCTYRWATGASKPAGWPC